MTVSDQAQRAITALQAAGFRRNEFTVRTERVAEAGTMINRAGRTVRSFHYGDAIINVKATGVRQAELTDAAVAAGLVVEAMGAGNYRAYRLPRYGEAPHFTSWDERLAVWQREVVRQQELTAKYGPIDPEPEAPLAEPEGASDARPWWETAYDMPVVGFETAPELANGDVVTGDRFDTLAEAIADARHDVGPEGDYAASTIWPVCLTAGGDLEAQYESDYVARFERQAPTPPTAPLPVGTRFTVTTFANDPDNLLMDLTVTEVLRYGEGGVAWVRETRTNAQLEGGVVTEIPLQACWLVERYARRIGVATLAGRAEPFDRAALDAAGHAAPVADSSLVIYTTAPANYDYSDPNGDGVRREATPYVRRASDGVEFPLFRVVCPTQYLRNSQAGRYVSGMYLALPAAELPACLESGWLVEVAR